MNENEHLLVCLSEECSEVQQAISKALRFGLKDGYPGGSTTNSEDIGLEITDLLAVVDMCRDRGLIAEPNEVDELYHAKQRKVTQFMGYARKTGALSG